MKKKIAIVEDNPDNMLLAEVLLEDLYELNKFENGFDALEGMRMSPPDLVLLDISLPGMDGIEILKIIREDKTLKHLPVIALTAHAMVGDRQKFLAIGFDGYLTKPIVDEELMYQAIKEQLNKND
ncbi:MAG: response regulator [Fidelibacterota bacterium]